MRNTRNLSNDYVIIICYYLLHQSVFRIQCSQSNPIIEINGLFFHWNSDSSTIICCPESKECRLPVNSYSEYIKPRMNDSIIWTSTQHNFLCFEEILFV